jgi:hypothetical protein
LIWYAGQEFCELVLDWGGTDKEGYGTAWDRESASSGWLRQGMAVKSVLCPGAD